ncbi:MAG TPA: SulP family inorganic anion transporter [Rariglobus sp.]|jgi:SulP family sulfate permease|nr:SulP family inorganic anion transporter [Rariglobus sp.]
MSATDELKETLVDASELGARMFKVRIPFIAELRNYSWDKCRGDLLAGATLTLVSIPQAVGFSLILGVPPAPVVVSVVIGGFIGALFFSSRHLVFGPTSSISLIIAATVAAHATPDFGVMPLIILMALLIGLIQLVAGLLNFGEVTKFISRSVVVGYSTGIGVLLMASQLHNLLGYEEGPGQSFADSLWSAVTHLATGEVSPWALGLGVATWLIFELVRKFRRSWPEALIGLAVLGIAAKIYTHLNVTAPFLMIRDEGALHAMLPSFVGLHFGMHEMHMLSSLVSAAIAIGILGMLEAASITKSLAAKSGQKIEPNQELIGMGAANIACSLFGAVPGSSSFARSAVNYQSGGRTQLSSMFSSAAVLLVLLFVTPVFNFIPVAALAAHLIRVGIKMINRGQIRMAYRSTRSDAVVFVITLGSCLLLSLDTAIYVGIGVALALFLQKTSTPTLVEYGFNDQGQLSELSDTTKRTHSQISIIHVEGELFFGAADLFQDEIRRQAEDRNIRVFILRMKNARHLDASTVMALETLHDYLKQTGRHLLISGSNEDVTRVLQRSGLLKQMGEENVFPAEANLTMSTKRALTRASQLLKQEGIAQKPEVRIFYDRKQGKASDGPTSPAAPGDHDQAGDYEI